MRNKHGGPRFLVVVVAFRSSPILENCLASLANDKAISEVVVVDNSSEVAAREVVQRLNQSDSRFVYVDPTQNLGFGRGSNRGVAEGKTGWTHVFFVNPDVRLTAPLTPLAEELDRGAAIVAGLLVSPDHAGAVNARPLVTMRRELFKALIGTRAYAMPHPTSDGRAISVEQVDGALLGMAAGTFAELGGFDERFDLYYEDVDICRRAERIGGVRLITSEYGIHDGGASFATASAKAYSLNRVSRVRYLNKTYGSGQLARFAIAAIAVTEWLARSISRQGEGARIRNAAVRLQFRELAHPGSVDLLKAEAEL